MLQVAADGTKVVRDTWESPVLAMRCELRVFWLG